MGNDLRGGFLGGWRMRVKIIGSSWDLLGVRFRVFVWVGVGVGVGLSLSIGLEWS